MFWEEEGEQWKSKRKFHSFVSKKFCLFYLLFVLFVFLFFLLTCVDFNKR